MTELESTTAVVIYTDSFRVEGRINLLPGARLTDYVRSAEAFIAVTDATVQDKHGVALFRAPFLDIGRDFIEIIAPAANITAV
jgi:hypothetical protein